MGILICIYYIPIICLVINHENASTNTDSPYGITFDAVAGRGHRLLQSDARIFLGDGFKASALGFFWINCRYIYINKLYIYILYYFIVYYIYYSVYTHKIMIITVMTICNHD